MTCHDTETSEDLCPSEHEQQQHEGRKAGVSNPGDQRGGTAGTFEQTRTALEAAWQVFAANRTESGSSGVARSTRLDRAEICGGRPRRKGAGPMKFTDDRPYSDPEKAARKLLEIANSVEVVHDGRIYIELINGSFLFSEWTWRSSAAG
jgi:hypothetical protein